MEKQKQFDWVDFYSEFAFKLLDYKDRRAELIDKIKAVYDDIGVAMPTIEKDNKLVDVDPFTVFGLFSRTMSKSSRIKILTAIKKLFNVKASVPTDFSGLPTIDARNAVYYGFINDRRDNDIDDLWRLFEVALDYVKSPHAEASGNFSYYFDIGINKKYNGNSKTTMALFWIAPEIFLSLDGRNRWYIFESGKIPAHIVDKLPKIKDKISAVDYLQIIEVLRDYLKSGDSKLKSLKELSLDALLYSEEVNKRRAAEKKAAATSGDQEKIDQTGTELEDIAIGENLDEEASKDYPAYSKNDFLAEVYMSKEDYDKLANLLLIKKNIILEGAPGVGKTFAAKRLAFSMMGVKDVSRITMVQFHQSYSYEDFVMGFRPTGDGFELKRGVFYNFCKKAEADQARDYFFVIDEINRGNLSRIFGELFMLVENDKRGLMVQLLYSDEKFSVPKNVHIIGTMNTADRSLAMLDYALRRRFAFFAIKPGFTSSGFRQYQEGLNNEKYDKLITCIESLNNFIAADELLGEGFCIGHSYFCNLSPATINDQVLSGIIEYEIIPLLKEYWFDEPAKVKDWSAKLREAIK